MTRNKQGIIVGIMFVLTAAFDIGFAKFMNAMSFDFVLGSTFGILLSIGLMALALRSVREIS
jgi:hypothetical protein